MLHQYISQIVVRNMRTEEEIALSCYENQRYAQRIADEMNRDFAEQGLNRQAKLKKVNFFKD